MAKALKIPLLMFFELYVFNDYILKLKRIRI